MAEMLRVVGAVIEHEGKILVCRRRPEKAEGGKWEFPGGKVEPGESPHEALKRELLEELGLKDIKISELVNRETTESNYGQIDLACYRVSVHSLPSSSTDHDALIWLSANKLKTLNWANADWPIVNTIAPPRRNDS